MIKKFSLKEGLEKKGGINPIIPNVTLPAPKPIVKK